MDKVLVIVSHPDDEVLGCGATIAKHTQNGDTVNIAGFGQFSAKTRAGRIGVNPQKPSEKITIPPVTVPKFKAGKALKDSLKGKRDSKKQTISSTQAPWNQI